MLERIKLYGKLVGLTFALIGSALRGDFDRTGEIELEVHDIQKKLGH